MPHISTYGGSYFSAQPEKEDFGSFEPRDAKFQEASTNDELTGLKGLNWGEICDVGASLSKSNNFIKLGDIKGDRHFTTGGGGDSITGEGRSTKIWTNGGASTFEDSNWIWQDCNDVKCDQDNNDMVIGVGDIKGELQTTDLRSENRFFEELIQGSSFMASPNPVLELGGNSGPGGTSFMTGQFDMPTDNLSGTAGPGGTSF